MLKWFLVLLVVVLVSGWLDARRPAAARRLPGDFVFSHRGRVYRFPIVSTLLWSLFAWFLLRVL